MFGETECGWNTQCNVDREQALSLPFHIGRKGGLYHKPLLSFLYSSRNIVKIQCFVNCACRAFIYIKFVKKADLNPYFLILICLIGICKAFRIQIQKIDLIHTWHCTSPYYILPLVQNTCNTFFQLWLIGMCDPHRTCRFCT